MREMQICIYSAFAFSSPLLSRWQCCLQLEKKQNAEKQEERVQQRRMRQRIKISMKVQKVENKNRTDMQNPEVEKERKRHTRNQQVRFGVPRTKKGNKMTKEEGTNKRDNQRNETFSLPESTAEPERFDTSPSFEHTIASGSLLQLVNATTSPSTSPTAFPQQHPDSL